MFYAPGLIFGGNEGAGCRFHVLHSRSRFPQYRERRVPFSSFALLNSFRAVPRASGPIFMFCATGLVFGGTEGVSCRFHVLGSRIRFRRYRGRRLLFSCFARLYLFSAVPRASGPVFKFYAPRLIFDGTEGVRSRFLILRQIPFSCLSKLFAFMKIFGRKTTHNLVQINIITPNYAYYKIVQLTLQNE
jgi:hypothetical protein